MKRFPVTGEYAMLVHVLTPLHKYAQDHGFQVFIGGGCVRDMAHEQVFNDIDVAVVGDWDRAGSISDMMDIVMELPGSYDVEKVYDRDETCSYTARFPDEEDRYDTIVKLKSVDGLPSIDLLFHAETFNTMYRVIDGHDHSINQFAAWLGSEGLIVAYLGFEPLYGRCVQLRKNVLPERVEHVKGICERLGWTYSNKTTDQVIEDDLDDLLFS